MTRFVVQLEYLVDPVSDEWAMVVRYDHDAEGADESTHDVTEEGVHIDIYREGEKIDTHELTPPLPANEALETVEDHLAEHLEGIYGDSNNGTGSIAATHDRRRD